MIVEKRGGSALIHVLPWHTKSIFVKCGQPPEKPVSAAICRAEKVVNKL